MNEPWPDEAVFCQACGSRLERRDIHGQERGVCPACGRIDFRSPSVSAAVVCRDDQGRLLLVKRAEGSTQPGKWSIPAGYVDYGEEIRVAAARELLEETGLVVRVGAVRFVATNDHDPAKITVGIWFDGTVTGGEMVAGDDASDVGWFRLDQLPELAFDTDEELIAQL